MQHAAFMNPHFCVRTRGGGGGGDMWGEGGRGNEGGARGTIYVTLLGCRKCSDTVTQLPVLLLLPPPDEEPSAALQRCQGR
jgi:hypothetical protein